MFRNRMDGSDFYRSGKEREDLEHGAPYPDTPEARVGVAICRVAMHIAWGNK